MNVKLRSLYCCILLIPVINYSQNIFQSNLQMMFQPNINFSSASSYEGTVLSVFHRNQWVKFSGSPKVLGANVFKSKGSNAFGVSFFQDKVGVHDDLQISLNYSYSLQLTKTKYLSFSLSPTLNQKRSDYNGLVQINQSDALITSTSNYSLFSPNAKFGTYLYSKNFYVGISTPNLLDNNIINGTKVENKFDFEKINYNFHIGFRKKLNKTNNLLASSYVKTVEGSFLHTEFNIMWETMSEKLGIGASFKTSKEIVGILRVQIMKRLMMGYAFQYTLTDLNNYNQGTHEILLVYNMSPIERVKLKTPRF